MEKQCIGIKTNKLFWALAAFLFSKLQFIGVLFGWNCKIINEHY